MFAISMLKLSCGRQYRSDDLNGYAVCFGVAYGHSCPARLAVIGGKQQVSIIDEITVPNEHGAFRIYMTGRRSDVGQFKKQVVPRPVFLRPFTGLIVEWADHFQNNLRMLLAQFNDGLCCEHIHTQSTARDKMTIREVLLLRQQLAKSSVKKYIAMKNAVCADGRARGMFMFYGANRTGRFSGRLIQLQNLPQNKMTDLGVARELVRSGDYEQVKLLYDDVPDTLSQLIRTAFISAQGYKFVVSDFAAIEARVIAWLAGEKWRQKVFLEGGDIYCASASAMFHVPVVKHGINGHLRQRGKVAELALGYGGSVGALKAMGALEMGVPEEELKPLVDAWRESNPNIVRLWWDVDRAVMEAVIDKSETETHGIRFMCTSGMLFITLPSGRRLSYVKPQIGTNQFGGDAVTYMGIGSTKKWERLESYGPKFCENIVQAISRDILCYAMQTLSTSRIVAHVHDELIIECPPEVSLQAVSEQMARTPSWAPGLVLRADGDEMAYYQKA